MSDQATNTVGPQMLDGIDVGEFAPGATLAELYQERYKSLPVDAGVYLVVRDSTDGPSFAQESPAGWFKQKDPSYPISVVNENWVLGAKLVYIGKAAGRRGLRQRVCQLIDFGYGKAIGHRGGRALWHLEDFPTFRLSWQVCDATAADEFESQLIQQFREHHGARPFANMSK